MRGGGSRRPGVEGMQKKLLPQVILIAAVALLFAGLLTVRFLTDIETKVEKVKVGDEMVERTVKSKKFPVNLGLDLQGGVHFLVQALPPKNELLTDEKVQGLIEVLRNRLDPDGVREITIQKQGTNRVLVEISGEQDADQVERHLVSMAWLEFLDSRGQFWEAGTEKPENAKVVFSGDDLASARVGFKYGRPVVEFEFKKSAADEFGKFTARNIDKYLCIALDGVMISCPVIQTAIFGGTGIIEGNFTEKQVRELVNQLNAGRLPVLVEVLEKRVVGPTLGATSIRQSSYALILGVVLIFLFMSLYYKLPGVLADVAMAFYIIVSFGMLSLVNATLTLPGIAGLILSIGMAVDANIIIFERLKEELRIGKTLKAALDAGFSRAFTAILDGNVTTLIATAVLYAFGTGPIRGFAVTISLGIVVGMFSALIVTRVLLMLASNSKGLQPLSLYGVRPSKQDQRSAAAH